jgi:hypothetical protein
MVPDTVEKVVRQVSKVLVARSLAIQSTVPGSSVIKSLQKQTFYVSAWQECQNLFIYFCCTYASKI